MSDINIISTEDKDSDGNSEIQNIIWEIFLNIDRICKEENINYYMLGGTLLGAVRHKGFIPWDDDIDIGMPRDDYERFLKLVEKKLPDYLELQSFEKNQFYHYYFSRVADKRYKLRREGSIEKRQEEVWVDIFPLDGMPDNFFVRKVHMFKLLVTRMMYHISCFEKVNIMRPNRPLSEKIIIKFVQVTGLGRNGSYQKKLIQLDKLLKKYKIENSQYIINFMGQYKFKEMFPKKFYGEGSLYDFNSVKLPGPENAHAVLTQMYGDYMTPPKKEDRNAHAISFNGDKENIYE